MAPLKTIRPGLIPFWMLNDASTVEEKIRYLRACKAGGIEAMAMHCRSGNLIPYASTEWFHMIRALVEEGHRLGMDMWLYDEDPYPSGAAGGQVMAQRADLRAEYLALQTAPDNLRPGQLWLIGGNRVEWAGLVPLSKPLPATDLTGTVGSVRVDWFMGRWDSRYYYEETPIFPCARGDAVRQRYALRVPAIPRGYRLVAITAHLAGVEGSWGGLPDLLHPDTFTVFRELVLDRYVDAVGKYFGSTIPGIFTDEAKPHGGMPITRDLWRDFQKAYGYGLRPRLYQLFGEPVNEDYERVRLDYRRWILRRFLEVFVKPYRAFCDRHDLNLVGHFSPEDDPIQEVACLGSAMPIMKEMSWPGTDLIIPFTGTSKAPTLNLGSLRIGSICSQHGHPYAMSESLGLSGWTMTSERSRQILAWQMVLGVSRFFLHGFYTSNEGVQNYEALPDHGPYSSIFHGTSTVNQWLKRLGQRLEGSTEQADVAIVNSLVSYWRWAPDMNTDRLKELRASLWQTILGCLQSHVGVHLVDEGDMARAHLSPGGIRVGQRIYTRIIVPDFDLLNEETFARLQTAAECGCGVFWFGGHHARRLVQSNNGFLKAPPLLGEVSKASFPTESWCRKRLSPAIHIEGKGREEVYLRRFESKDGKSYCLAVNLSDQDRTWCLRPETPGKFWVSAETDGLVEVKQDGTKWSAPAYGCGLFVGEVVPVKNVETTPACRALALQARTFKRLSDNLLRLSAVEVRRRSGRPVTLDYPRPYWQIFKDYRADEVYHAYIGDVPLESRVPHPAMTYRFHFDVAPGFKKAVRLILDPRCARGRFTLFLDGRKLGVRRVFPLDHITPEQVVLPRLKPGRHRLDVRFEITSAMEGLLSQLYLQGDFDVVLKRGKAPLLQPASDRVSARGWNHSGLPHYMGACCYRWEETMTADEAGGKWVLELDSICDSAELQVNGLVVGRKAWSPWQWDLSNVITGTNAFEITVWSTAGNKHELDWPNQSQGWIGGGRLWRVES